MSKMKDNRGTPSKGTTSMKNNNSDNDVDYKNTAGSSKDIHSNTSNKASSTGKR